MFNLYILSVLQHVCLFSYAPCSSSEYSHSACFCTTHHSSSLSAERVFPSMFVVVLPWHKTFLPHVGGLPDIDANLKPHSDSANDHLPMTKIKHPSGECGRNPSTGRGFQLKETLQLSDGLYKEILVIYFAWSVSPYPHLLMLYTGICSRICDAKPERESDYH